jgi:SAM-dependent methyltransferase
MTPEIKELIEANKSIRLDIACGSNKQPGFVGIDIQALPGVDIVQDIEKFPWVLPDECASLAVASHIVEHIDPHGFTFVNFMNEIWRVLKVGGQLAITTPYAGSPGYFQDPTHCNPCNETTWSYFDPEDKIFGSQLWGFYQAKPWAIEQNFWNPYGNLEVVLRKRADIYYIDEFGVQKKEVKDV